MVEGLPNLLSGQRRELTIRNSHKVVVTALEVHWRGRHLGLEPSVPDVQIEFLSGLQTKSVSEGLGYDQTTRRINGRTHGSIMAENLPAY